MTITYISLGLAAVFGLLAFGALFRKALQPYGFSALVLAAGSLAVAFPGWFTSWGGFELKRSIGPLVQIVLLGMGMTLTVDDFRRTLRMPKAIGVGMVLQFSILPFISLLLVKLFGLTGGVAAGLVLIACVPGGTASNVVAYLARANVPLSITMTACSTLVSPFVTPLLVRYLAGEFMPIDVFGMVRSILTMVIGPMMTGVALHHFFPVLTSRLVRPLPGVAMAAIAFIVAITIALSRDELLRAGLSILGAAVCMNLAGLSLGYLFARLLGLDKTDSRTVSIEVGMQNGGMATGLAFNVLKDPLAALGAAIFGPFSAVSTSLLASWWGRYFPKTEANNTKPEELISSR